MNRQKVFPGFYMHVHTEEPRRINFPGDPPSFLLAHVRAARAWRYFADYLIENRLDVKSRIWMGRLLKLVELIRQIKIEIPATITELRGQTERLEAFCRAQPDEIRIFENLGNTIAVLESQIVRSRDQALKDYYALSATWREQKIDARLMNLLNECLPILGEAIFKRS